MSRVLEDDHYKRMTRVTVGVALKLTLTALWPSIGQNLQPFTGNGEVSIGVKILDWADKLQKTKLLRLPNKFNFRHRICMYIMCPSFVV